MSTQVDRKYLGITTSKVLKYSPYRIYMKGERCLYSDRLYESRIDSNTKNNPILGMGWDRII